MPSSAEMCYAVRTILPQQQRMKYLQDLEDEIRHVVGLYPTGIRIKCTSTLPLKLLCCQ